MARRIGCGEQVAYIDRSVAAIYVALHLTHQRNGNPGGVVISPIKENAGSERSGTTGHASNPFVVSRVAPMNPSLVTQNDNHSSLYLLIVSRINIELLGTISM